MATGQDVRDILALPSQSQASGSRQPQQGSRTTTTTAARNGGHQPHNKKKKPARVDGISRELYALLGDNTPSLTFVHGVGGVGGDGQGGVGGAGAGAGKFMPKFKRRPQRVQSWVEAPFRNPARQDGLVLRHWVPASEAEQTRKAFEEQQQSKEEGDGGGVDVAPQTYRFADLNTNSGVYRYSNDEYHQHLRDEDWTKEETDYLIDMCTSFDLRFVIINDRYVWPGKERSMEDLKARYYAVCRRLIRSRISTEDIDARQQLLLTYAFDRARERERKKHVARLFSRTPQQLAEEEALYVEARRLEQNEGKFAAEREELLRLLGGWERLPNVRSETVAAAGSGLGGTAAITGASGEQDEDGAEGVRKGGRKRKASESVGADGATVTAGASSVSTPRASVAPLSAKQRAELRSAHFDAANNITRFDPQASAALANAKPPYPHMTGTPSTYPPVAPASSNAATASSSASHGVFLRSTRMLAPRTNLALRTQEALAELQPAVSLRLTFPTRANCEKWEGVVGAVTSGLEMKRQLDRVQSELRIAKMRATAAAAAPANALSAAAGGTGPRASLPPAIGRRSSTAARSVTPQVGVSVPAAVPEASSDEAAAAAQDGEVHTSTTAAES